MTDEPSDWEPAFPGQRPPLQPGHTLTLTHGAYSPRKVEPLADLVLAEAVEDAPWLARPRHQASVRAWAREEARALLLSAYLDEHGLHDDEGRLRAAEGALHRAETRAANLRTALGLTPLAAARLGRDAAVGQASLASIWQAMDAEDAALTDGADDGAQADG